MRKFVQSIALKAKTIMKKILLLTVALAICSVSAASAARIRVRVMDFRFQPATISAHVGDVIIWRWVNGMHTTTSTSVPVGAQTWNSPIDSTHTQFRYGLRVAGTTNISATSISPREWWARLMYPPHHPAKSPRRTSNETAHRIEIEMGREHVLLAMRPRHT